MDVKPKIEVLKPIELVGFNAKMSLVKNTTIELWSNAAPKLKALVNNQSVNRYSLQVYPDIYFKHFNPQTEFTKWAAVEVAATNKKLNDLPKLRLEGGLYAVFTLKGSVNVSEFFQYIYSVWLPKSEYRLGDRPHFEVLGEQYKKNDPSSEEEVWIPIEIK